MKSKTDVLIVGAGPSGLTAAYILALHGVNFRIIDNDPGPTDESRATIVHGRTLELWDKLYLAEKAIPNGVQITGATLIRQGQVLAKLPISGAEEGFRTPFPFSIIHEQSKTERMMLDALEKLGQTVEWNTEYLHLEQTQNLAQVKIQTKGLEEMIEATWVVACDGARSPIRQTLGIEFEGKTYEQVAFLADVELETNLERNNIHLNYFREGFVGFVPMKNDANNLYRLIGTLPDELEVLAKKGELTELNTKHLQLIFEKFLETNVRISHTHRTAIYKLHRRMVKKYRLNRCFLVGDAAHVHSPAGGQGMNTGIGDAYNLAWKLAMVVKGEAQPALLESYETERIEVARAVLNGSDQGFALEATKQPWLQWFNNNLLPQLIKFGSQFGFVRRFAAKAFSQSWINYRNNSPAIQSSQTDTREPRAGDRAPFARLATSETSFELMRGIQHHVFVFEGLEPQTGFQLPNKLETLLQTYAAPVEIHAITKENLEMHSVYNVKNATMFFIRPDGHVAYRGSVTDLTEFDGFLKKILTKK